MSLEERLDAVERALTDGEQGPADLSDAATREERLDDAEARLDDLEERVAELEAATQAIRGYVGTVRSVNREVEETAEVAIATAERVERRLDEETPLTRREPVVPDHVDARTERTPDSDGRADERTDDQSDDRAERLAERVRDAL